MAQGKDPYSSLRPPRGLVLGEKAASRAKTLRALSRYFLRERGFLFALVAVVIVGVAAGVYAPVLQSRAIDAIADGRYDKLHALLFEMLLLYAFFALMIAYQGRFGAYLSQRIIRRLRADLFDRINALPVPRLDARPKGDLLSRMTSDADTVANVISTSFSALVAGALTIAGATLSMFLLSAPLALATCAAALLSLAVTKLLTRRARPLFRQRQQLLGAMSARVEESVSALPTLIAYGLSRDAGAAFQKTAKELARAGIRAEILSGSLGPLMNAINNLAFLIVTIVGAYLALEGRITIGIISAFLVYARQFSRPITEIAQLYGQIETAIAGAERIFAVLAEPAEDTSGEPLSAPRGAIDFSHIDFSYRRGTPVLRDFTLHVGAGTKVALVGATGSGKTTVTNLLLRFYDPDAGTIRIDGEDIRRYSRKSLRRAIGLVLQDTFLFDGTIRNNIAFGKPDATDEEICRAARLAAADTFIDRLHAGYDTRLAAISLSAGERQLLAIARACLTDPAILILDEATSNVDTRTEQEIQRAMVRLMAGRTCLVIAHRISTITDADEIIVMDEGRIAERGRHDELLRKKGRYAALAALQAGGRAT